MTKTRGLRKNIMFLGLLVPLSACDEDAAAPVVSVEKEAKAPTTASEVSYVPGTTGLPGNVQDAITVLNARLVRSIDDLDGTPCNGELGVLKIRYFDPSEVGDGPFTMHMRCLAKHPVLEFNPAYHDFGFSPTSYFVDVTNRGGTPVTITGFTCDGDCTSFTVTSDVCTNTELGTDDSCYFVIEFTPVIPNPCSFHQFDAAFAAMTDVPVGGSNGAFVSGKFICIQ